VPQPPDPFSLRRTALAVSVLDDIDLEPYGRGVVLRGGAPVTVEWRELRRVIAGADPESELARRRVRRHLVARRIVADLSRDELAARARPVGFAVDDVMHPGVGWVRERPLGGALDLGVGFVGVGSDPDAVVVLPKPRWTPRASTRACGGRGARLPRAHGGHRGRAAEDGQLRRARRSATATS
jgi:hypothetical protein